jgi:ABC-2 type transport system permease protein
MAESTYGGVARQSLVGTVAAKEFTEIRRDGRFRWMAALMVLLLVTALLAGWQRFAEYSRGQALAQGKTNEQWLKQGDKNPHSAAHFGNYAFKQPGPLAFFDNGIEPFAGSLLFMEAHKQNLAISRPANDLSAVARFGDLNGAMILQVLMPLLVIFLGFTAFSGERERGTLRQVIGMGVGGPALLWGKALGIGAAAAAAILPCIAVGAVAIAALSVPVAADSFGARVALMALAYGLYFVTFLFLTLAASATARTPRAALMVMVGFWAFGTFLAPKAASEVSKMLRPSPSFGAFEAAVRTDQVRGLDGVPTAAKFGKYVRELLRQYNVDSPAKLPIYFPAVRMQKLEDLDHEVFDHHFNALRAAYRDQRRLQDGFGIVAPLLPLESLSMGLAGTDLLHHDAFTRAAEDHRRLMVEKMNGYLGKAAVDLNGKSDSSNYMTADEAVFAIVPPFAYRPPSLAEVMGEYAPDLGLLAAWFLASVLLAAAAVRRLRPDVI